MVKSNTPCCRSHACGDVASGVVVSDWHTGIVFRMSGWECIYRPGDRPIE
nr:hypothetical protein [Kibdelosporangium sp. MJ126-NF4]CTQ90291.1 hypothetical protein [Kibdelosporangium sp. MJ126-NF4]